MTIHDIKNEDIQKMLIDLGFDQYSSYPGWAYDLAETLVSYGWKKNDQKT